MLRDLSIALISLNISAGVFSWKDAFVVPFALLSIDLVIMLLILTKYLVLGVYSLIIKSRAPLHKYCTLHIMSLSIRAIHVSGLLS